MDSFRTTFLKLGLKSDLLGLGMFVLVIDFCITQSKLLQIRLGHSSVRFELSEPVFNLILLTLSDCRQLLDL